MGYGISEDVEDALGGLYWEIEKLNERVTVLEKKLAAQKKKAATTAGQKGQLRRKTKRKL